MTRDHMFKMVLYTLRSNFHIETLSQKVRFGDYVAPWFFIYIRGLHELTVADAVFSFTCMVVFVLTSLFDNNISTLFSYLPMDTEMKKSYIRNCYWFKVCLGTVLYVILGGLCTLFGSFPFFCYAGLVVFVFFLTLCLATNRNEKENYYIILTKIAGLLLSHFFLVCTTNAKGGEYFGTGFLILYIVMLAVMIPLTYHARKRYIAQVEGVTKHES